MRLAKSILLAVLAVAVAVYASDCGATTTPEQAKQCCDSMPCASHGHHGQECCKTMPSMQAPFVQPSSVHGISFSPVLIAVMPASLQSHGLDASARGIAAQCHAPPIRYAPVLRPLRI